MNVIVIGAGLSGLAAAWRLQGAGHEVTVLEAKEHIGGRVGAVERDGFVLDQTLETLHSGQRHILGWIGELGLAEALLPLRPLQIVEARGGEARPIDPQRLTSVAAIPGVGWRDGLKLVRWSRLMSRYRPLLDPTAPERAASLDFRSVSDFARLYFGDSVYAHWVAPEVSDEFGADPAELSRVTALLIWCARSTGADRTALHGVPRGSLARVAEAAAARLSVRREICVTRIDELASGGFAVECRGMSGGTGALECDAVVVATSAATAAEIVDPIATPAERDYLGEVEMMPEIVMAASLGAAPSGMPQRVRLPEAEDQPFDSVLLEPGQADGRAPQGSGLVVLRATERFSRAHARTADSVVEKGLRSGLERLFPSVAASLGRVVLTRRGDARPRFHVGAYRALARFRDVQADRRSLGRRVYFAGDYLIGTTAEASVVAGLRAAQDLEADTRQD